MTTTATKTSGYYMAHHDCEKCRELATAARQQVEAEGRPRARHATTPRAGGDFHAGEYVAPAPAPAPQPTGCPTCHELKAQARDLAEAVGARRVHVEAYTSRPGMHTATWVHTKDQAPARD